MNLLCCYLIIDSPLKQMLVIICVQLLIITATKSFISIVRKILHMKQLIRSALLVLGMAFVASCATPAEQAEIDEVRQALIDAGLGQYTLGINERGGTVTITGNVELDEDRNQIVEVVRDVPGVTEVIDLIETADVRRLPEEEE